MSEYISREAAQKIICGWCGVCQNPTEYDLMHCDDICPQFAAIPAADVRPVVLCRDCKNADYSGMGKGSVWCDEMERAVSEDGWCYRGADTREES